MTLVFAGRPSQARARACDFYNRITLNALPAPRDVHVLRVEDVYVSSQRCVPESDLLAQPCVWDSCR